MIQKFSEEDLIYMIKHIQEKGMGLNDWEKIFIASLGDYMFKYGTLSPKQIEILDRIYSEKTI